MRGAGMRRADMDDTAANAAVGLDIADPRLLAVGQLPEPAAEKIIFSEPAELGIASKRQRLQHLIVYDRALRLLRQLFRPPATALKQLCELNAGIEIFYLWKLPAHFGFELGAPSFPADLQPLGCNGIERRSIRGDAGADGGDLVLK